MNNDPSNNVIDRMLNREVPTTEPQTVPETQPVIATTPVPVTNPAPQTTAPTEKKEKSIAIPLIMLILVFVLGGYIVFSIFGDKWFGNSNNNYYSTTGDNTEVVENTKTKEKEEEKEKKDNEEKDATEEVKESPKPEDNISNGETTSGSEEITIGGGGTNPTTGEVDIGRGVVLYLYVDSSIGMDGTDFKYVSHNASQVVAEVTVNGQTQTVTFPFGQEVKVNGIVNPIVSEYDAEDDAFKLNFK